MKRLSGSMQSMMSLFYVCCRHSGGVTNLKVCGSFVEFSQNLGILRGLMDNQFHIPWGMFSRFYLSDYIGHIVRGYE
jgi:hypothetical protein